MRSILFAPTRCPRHPASAGALASGLSALVVALGLVLGSVTAVAAAGSADPVFVGTSQLALRDDHVVPIDARRRTLSFSASTRRSAVANRVTPPARGSAGDPTLAGGALVVANTDGSGQRVQVALPAAGWRALGTASKPGGFEYRDDGDTAVVRKVVVKADAISVKARGPGWPYTLDAASQGSVGVRVHLGTADWCANAPARTTGMPPSSARYDHVDKFDGARDAAPPTTCPVGEATFQLTVTNGFGSGTYPVGAVVHVWASQRPADQLVAAWTGDAALLERPDEWHTTLVMPPHDVAVAATILDRPTLLAVSSFTGSTTRPKTVRWLIPPDPRGLVLFLHGTGGNDRFITTTEAFSVVLRALEAGYGVLGTEAEEAVAGDLDGDGKERWDVALSPANVDLANLNGLIADLRAAGTIGATTPLFALGMSNGGSMALSLGTVGASAIAPVFPQLRFRAVISHCASGRAVVGNLTTTPSAFLLCGNDDNDNVDNTEALAQSAAMAARGVPTVADLHPASPLYDERFVRVSLSLATSQALAAELRAAGFVGGGGNFIFPSDAILAGVTANPSLWPTFVGLSPAERNDVVDQLRAMEAEHQMFSDWAARAVQFLDAHNP